MHIQRKFTLDYPEKWSIEVRGAVAEFLKEFGLKPNYIIISSPHVRFTPVYRENIMKLKEAKIQHPQTGELIDIPKGTAMNIDSIGGNDEEYELKFCADESLDIYEFVLVYSSTDLRNPDPRTNRGSKKSYGRPVFTIA